MTLSLPDLAEIADLSKESTERVSIHFIEEKLIQVKKSTIMILDQKKLEKMASEK